MDQEKKKSIYEQYAANLQELSKIMEIYSTTLLVDDKFKDNERLRPSINIFDTELKDDKVKVISCGTSSPSNMLDRTEWSLGEARLKKDQKPGLLKGIRDLPGITKYIGLELEISNTNYLFILTNFYGAVNDFYLKKGIPFLGIEFLQDAKSKPAQMYDVALQNKGLAGESIPLNKTIRLSYYADKESYFQYLETKTKDETKGESAEKKE